MKKLLFLVVVFFLLTTQLVAEQTSDECLLPEYLNALPMKSLADATTDNPVYYSTVLNRRALAYRSLGRYSDAAEVYAEIVEIRAGLTPAGRHYSYVKTLIDLAELYMLMGRSSEAERLFEEAMEICSLVEPVKGNLFYIDSINRLTAVYYSRGRYEEVERLYELLLELKWLLKPVGEHPCYAAFLTKVAAYYFSNDRFSEAILLQEEAAEIYKQFVPAEHHILYAAAISKLAFYYLRMDRFYDAELLQLEAMEIYRQLEPVGEHPLYAASLNRSGRLYLEMGRFIEAQNLLSQSFNVYKNNVEDNSIDRTIEEKTEIYTTLTGDFIDFFSFMEQSGLKSRELLELSHHFDLFSKEHKPHYNWQDVRERLADDEAAVEVVRYSFFREGWPDEIHYAFIIIRGDRNGPDLIFSTEGSRMEGELLESYKAGDANAELFSVYWAEVDGYLRGIKKIYLSPDGVYKDIELGKLRVSGGKLYDREVVRVKSSDEVAGEGD